MKFSTTSFAAGAVAVLVLGSGTAYAATGGKFILGKSNYAGATSSLSNKNGTALALNSKSGTAPLKVNRTVKVANLNSDLLDGLDSSSLARSGMRTGSFYGSGEYGASPDEFVAAVTCPAGTVLTGGGFFDNTLTGYIAYNGPFGGNTWGAVAYVDPETDTDPATLEAYATCLNPKGSVAGGLARTTAPDAILERTREGAAARSAR